jgi:hypothetical protein
LNGANLQGADLTGADLSQADLTGADLHGANLTQAFVTGADLRDATLTDVSVVQATGLSTIRISIVSPHDGIQMSYLLVIPACAVLVAWWRRRIGDLWRRRAVRPADLAKIAIGIPLAMAGIYAVCCVAVRAIITYVIGWLWGILPGPLGAVGLSKPFAQLGAGLGAILLASMILREEFARIILRGASAGILTGPSARLPPAASTPGALSAGVPAGAPLVIGVPSPGSRFPEPTEGWSR